METCFDRTYTFPLQVKCGGKTTYSFHQFQSHSLESLKPWLQKLAYLVNIFTEPCVTSSKPRSLSLQGTVQIPSNINSNFGPSM